MSESGLLLLLDVEGAGGFFWGSGCVLDAWGIVPHAGLQPVALMPGLRPAPPRRLIPSRNEGIPPVIAGVGVVPDLGHGSRLG